MVVRNGNADNTSISTNLSYFIRELTDLGGATWIQYVRNENGISYGAWNKIVTTQVEKDTYANTSVKNGSAVCRRQGNVVDIVATGDVRSLSANTFVTWVTIDAKYRPTENRFIPVANGGVNGRFAVINADGRIQIYSTTAISSAQSFAFNITYIVD